jgi:outer membrane protein assembly factor BamB
VSTTTGALDPNFNPQVGGGVSTVAINRARTHLYLGGNFISVGSTARPYLVDVDPTTGKVQGPEFSSIPARVRDVTVKDDGSAVYAAVGGKYNSAVQLDPVTGKQAWRVHVDGDTQAVISSNGYVYMGFHDGYQGDNVLRLLAVDPRTGDVNPSFMPSSGSYPGVLTLDADGRHLVAGGLFPEMGGVSVKGLSIHAAG